MTGERRSSNGRNRSRAAEAGAETEMRIIGGHFRGRRLRYHGDPIVRPMKHRVREAIFNLISTESKDRHVIDLFAGTGALGLEALSRGADNATFIERHVPSARIIEENLATLGVESRTTLMVTSAFLWSKRDLPSQEKTAATDRPWLVFFCPPYEFFISRTEEMQTLIATVTSFAPPESTLVVEADERFDFSLLAGDNPQAWDVRTYPPAVVGLWRLPAKA